MVNKLQRFNKIAQMNHVLEYTDFQDKEKEKPKGHWHSKIFGNSNPIVLELGCGKAVTTTSLAELHPDRNFIGIDIKGSRIWKGAKRAQQKKLDNVRFLRMYIDHLDEYFDENEVSEIWITFPDPYPRAGDRSKRLSSPRFLAMYKQILKPLSIIHFKTDNNELLKYTLHTVADFGGEIITRFDNLDRERAKNATLGIKTSFEKKHLAREKTIKYCKFKLV